MHKIQTLAKELGCSVEENPVLARYTTFRIGGTAPLCIELPIEAAAPITKAIYEEGLSCFWIGKGSNLLVSDQGIPNILLKIKNNKPINIDQNRLTCDGGIPVIQLCKKALELRLAGAEFAYGIPGTIGGGVYMNAGAYGGEMSQILHSARILTAEGKEEELSVKDLELGYRHSILMEQGGVVLSATFELREDGFNEINDRMNDFLQRRKDKQPLEYGSAGSFFKRPVGHFAGGLIEQCGLKGLRVGDAQVSEKHAGFIINLGNATCKDVKQLANEVKHRVLEETGVTLEPEVRLLGETWEE